MSCAIPTSRTAYQQVRPKLSPMQRTVFDGILSYRRNRGRWPTASEAHNYLVEQGSVEPNSCTKTRVTEMKKGEDLDNPILTEYRQLQDPERSNPWTVRPTPEAMQ